MSLLNQVLQDLDDRNQPQVRRPVRLAAAPEVVGYVDDLDDSDGRDWVRIGTWSAVGVAMMLAAWMFHDTDKGAHEAGLPVPSAAEVADPGAEVPAPVPVETVQRVPDLPAPAAVPVPAVIPDALAEMPDALPEPIAVAQVGPGGHDLVATVQAAPESSTGTDADSRNGTAAPAVEPAEGQYLPLRNTEPPAEAETRPAKPHRRASSSVSVKKAKESAPQSLEQISQAIAEGELATAEHLLQQRLKLDPKDVEARELLIGLMLRGERYGSAGQQLDQALVSFPGHGTFVLIKARMLAHDGEIDEAITLLVGAPVGSKGKAERLQMLGALYQQRSRYEDALRSYRALLALTPDSGPAWVGLAICLDGLGDAEALDAYTRALDLGGLPEAAGRYARQRIGEMERKGG